MNLVYSVYENQTGQHSFLSMDMETNAQVIKHMAAVRWMVGLCGTQFLYAAARDSTRTQNYRTHSQE